MVMLTGRQEAVILTMLENFLWADFKEKCYAVKLERIEHLKVRIRDAIAEIRFYADEKMHDNWSDRTGYCEASCVSHMNEIMFHFYPKQSHLFQNVFVIFYF